VLTFALLVTGMIGLVVVVVGAGLIAQKIAYRVHVARDVKLEEIYRQKLDPILLADLHLEGLDPDSSDFYHIIEEACNPLLADLKAMRYFRRRMHRAALKRVMLEMSRLLAGETRVRLTHVFELTGFVREELDDLGSRKWWKRAEACRNLALMQARTATERLVGLLNDREEDVRTEAAMALVAITGVNGLRLLLANLRHLSAWTSIQLSNVVLPMASAAVPDLIDGLKSKWPGIQGFCVDMLGEIGDVAACDPLIEFASKAEPGLRSRAFLVLGKLGNEKAKNILIAGLQDGDERSRVHAARALGYLASPDTAPVLRDHLECDTVAVRRATGKSLAMIQDAGRKMLIRAYHTADTIGKRIILQSLEELGVPEKKLQELER
jgi:hypothetical protein